MCSGVVRPRAAGTDGMNLNIVAFCVWMSLYLVRRGAAQASHRGLVVGLSMQLVSGTVDIFVYLVPAPCRVLLRLHGGHHAHRCCVIAEMQMVGDEHKWQWAETVER